MMIDSRHKQAIEIIQRNLIQRLIGEGKVTERRARQLRTADISAVFDECLRHTERLIIPFADTVMIVEQKESVQWR